MITLISGDPGAGKTAYVIAQLLQQVALQRTIYVMGVPGLKLPFIPTPPVSDWTSLVAAEEDATIMHPHFTGFEEGSLIVIDEAQRLYRQRISTSRVPDHVAAFEYHRHRGLDFILITQYPTFVDKHVLHLVTQHLHIRGNWAGRTLLEWPQSANPESKTDRAMAVTRRYTLPSKVFHLYESASVHTKIERRIPVALYIVIACFLSSAFLFYYLYGNINARINPASSANALSLGTPQSTVTNQSTANGGLLSAKSDSMPLVSADFVPRINTRPESAPLYDQIRKPQSLPAVVGCVDYQKSCRCYTDQATNAFLTDSQCREWLKNRPYNPWVKQDDRSDRPVEHQKKDTDSKKPVSSGGSA